MNRGSPVSRLALWSALSGACVVMIASPAIAQFANQRAVIRGGFVRSSIGVGFSRAAPYRAACAPLIGCRAVRSPLLNATFCKPRVGCPPFVVAPVAPCYNVNTFGLYPSSRLDVYGGGYYFNGISPSVNTIDAPDMTPDYSPPPNQAAAGPAAPVYGFRSTNPQNGGGDRALNDALLAYRKRRDDGGPKGPSPEQEALRIAQQVGVALGRGDKEFELGRYDRARDEYLHAMVLAGDEQGPRISYGLAQFALGNYSEASRSMMHAAGGGQAIDPASFDLRRAYGRPLDFKSQLEQLERYTFENPKDLDALFLLGFARACGGDAVGGADAFERYLDLARPPEELRPFIERALADRS